MLNDLESHLRSTGASEALVSVLSCAARACSIISEELRYAGVRGNKGETGQTNVQGETQKSLDLIANHAFLKTLREANAVDAYASEELESIAPICPGRGLVIAVDPLDGSANVSTNGVLGSIFSIMPSISHSSADPMGAFLQRGQDQLAAGYAIYGPSTLLVIAVNSGVAEFSLDESSSWSLQRQGIRLPGEAREFFVNAANSRYWDDRISHYIGQLIAGRAGPRERDFNMRWSGCMVADIHRTLMHGGVFMYPSDSRAGMENGKLRLLYEANPMAFIFERAGGAGTSGRQRLLDIQPRSIHQRTSVIMGSATEVAYFENMD